MRIYQTITVVIILTLLSLTCTSIKDQQGKDNYLPDLRINNVQYRIERHEIDTDRPDQPQMTLMGLLDIVLVLIKATLWLVRAAVFALTIVIKPLGEALAIVVGIITIQNQNTVDMIRHYHKRP